MRDVVTDIMMWKEWIVLVVLCTNLLSAAPDKYYQYDLQAKKGGNSVSFVCVDLTQCVCLNKLIHCPNTARLMVIFCRKNCEFSGAILRIV